MTIKRGTFTVFPAGTVSSDAAVNTSIQFLGDYFNTLTLYIKRTADTGTCTMDVKVQGKSPTTGDWADVPLATCVQYADNATGVRQLILSPYSVADTEAGGDLRGTLTVSNDKIVQAILPAFWRVAVTSGGTTVSNTYSIGAVLAFV